MNPTTRSPRTLQRNGSTSTRCGNSTTFGVCGDSGAQRVSSTGLSVRCVQDDGDGDLRRGSAFSLEGAYVGDRTIGDYI